MVLTALLMLLVYQSVTEGFNIVLQANVGRCLHVGDTLELHCSISNWEETHDPDLNQLQIIHKNGGKVNTSVVDNRTVLGTVSNVKAVGKLIFECRNKSDFNEYNYLSFEVTEPDPMPEDIMCIANGAVNKVVCSWESRDRCTTWRLFYSVNGEPETECELPVQNISKHCASGSINSNLKLRNSCHKEEPLQLECILKISNVHQTFRLERKSSFGLRRETEIKKIFNDSIVKLDPIENLQTFTNNVRSYEVTRILFRELHPFTEYNITVTCKVSGSPYWGDAVQRSFITDEDVPLTGPHTTHHSYLLAKCKSYNADSCLTIHTKQIDVLEARGIICGFKVEMRGSHRSDLKQEFEFTNESTTLEIGPLKRGITPPYHVSIWSKTSKGLSINSTDILIYPREAT
ncbi:uncharacterized protein LOC132549835 [Ylistrum balloti]|uniref:uncharacterized protein LOC132549835 n=1 Tax=Ylistrum balloti TaxID=509963 RepID=UPI002905E951|nr:uncharacterized protein LOC132549835 [Ylistrum balloti]